MVFHTQSPEETKAAARQVAALLRPGDLIAYRGGMGAGKTTFTAGLAQGLGSGAWVSSPTFALVHQYDGPIPLCHFDMFRITSLEDLYSTGFFDYLDQGAVLAVDECFLPLSDGAGPGLAPCLAEHPNLLLLRAFTKSYAMAGLRLGYALSANGGLLERMAAAGPPWSVSTPAQAAGLAALEQCPDWPEKARTLLASERPALSDGLAALGLEVVPGQANYLLFRAAGAADLKERMLMRGVLIRSCANYHGLGNDWYRVCVGQAEQNRRLLAALKEVL